MRRATLVIAWFMMSAWATAAQARQPVVVELFTSQGCSSCIAADSFLDKLADRPGVLALTLAVDYWDYLGWNDTFAKPEFTARQRAYMQRLSSREVYTPQIVVDGKGQTAGADHDKVEALIGQAMKSRKPKPPSIRLLRHSRVTIGHGQAPVGGADVWLVRYDPTTQEVTVKRGENRGQTLTQRNVVHELVRLGPWTGRPRIYAIPPSKERGSLKACILVQAPKGGRILAVLKT